MTSDTITEIEYNTAILALAKCYMLQGFVKSGEFKMCIVAAEHVAPAAQKGFITMVLPFRFPEMTEEEYMALMQKLSDASELAWLREQKEKGG